MATRKPKNTMRNKSADKKSTKSISSNKECQNSASTTTEDTMSAVDRNRAMSIMELAINAKEATEETAIEIERDPFKRKVSKT